MNIEIAELLNSTQSRTNVSTQEIKTLVSILDLTSLNPQDTEESITKLCLKASTSLGKVAAVCVYPKFVGLALKLLNNKAIKIASVANFPTGKEKLDTTLVVINEAIRQGADEMDIVFPYATYQSGNAASALAYVKHCKQACGDKLMKVILEISEFDELEQLYSLSKDLIDAGADFIKTSTGKSKQGATLEGASVMLLALKACQQNNIGFKASGGIKTIEQAISYVDLAKKIMGENWIEPRHLRIGASSLLDVLNIYGNCSA